MTVTPMPQSNIDSPEMRSNEAFLKLVGKRVRDHRTKVRMSRKKLAEKSGVSERYLAQLESGQGNMSIVLLRKVTNAIGLRLNVLVADEDPQTEFREALETFES